MKRILSLGLLTLLTIVLAACQTTTTTTLSTTTRTTRDTSWKVVYDAVPTSPDFKDNVSVCYQIFPIAWADSNGDGYGDFNGIAENIDYLADTLQVDCIWMNPFNPSPSYHKYDVTDFYEVDPQFGTMADLENLLSVAHDNGIRVLMDYVINHTALTHPWFVNSSMGPASSYRDFYVWNDLKDRAAFPSRSAWYLNNGSYYFASFWSQMPELNYDNQAVRTEIKAIATYWLNKGIDGFRIDAAKHIYDTAEYPLGTQTLRENINWFKEFNDHVKSVDPDALVLGEVYVLSSAFVANYYEGMDSAFNFDFADKLIYSAIAGYDSTALSSLIAGREAFELKRTDPIDSLFLTNHDQDRVADRLGHNPDKIKLVNRVLMTMPGIAWIYYGEELGMSGVKPDSQIRQPFKWDGEQSAYITTAKPNGIAAWTTYNQSLLGVNAQLIVGSGSILESYKTIIGLRQQSDVLKKGDLVAADNPNNRLMAYTRTYEGVTYLVIHNFSASAQTTTHNLTTMNLIWSSAPIDLDGNVLTISPYQTAIYAIDNPVVVLRNPTA